jgi:hypothetical protein
MYSRKIEDCVKELQDKYILFDKKMHESGIAYMITCTARNIIEQIALYMKGRLPLRDVNRFMVIADLPILVKDLDNKIVTWTLNSKHVTNMFDKDLDNDFSRAFDIAILKDGKPIWDIKVSVNYNTIPDYEEAGIIGESVGLKWGGRFTNPDMPHFEI